MQEKPSRIIVVSSSAYSFGEISLDDLDWQSRKYGAWPAYGYATPPATGGPGCRALFDVPLSHCSVCRQSKLANLLFTAELTRR